MKVLYLSKASRVVAHRDKLAHLARRLDLHPVIPEEWGSAPLEESEARHPPLEVLPAIFHGHNHLHLYRGLGRTLDRVRPDLIHADEEPFSLVTAQVAFLARRRRIPFVFFGWENLDKRLPPPFGALRRWVLGRASGAIAGTGGAAELLRRLGYRGPLRVIPQMGVDADRFCPDPEARRRIRARLGVDGGSVVVGFVGRLVPEKGVDILLEALAGRHGLHGVLVGGGPEEAALRARAERAELRGRIHFAGPVPSAEVPAWMAAFDVLALPSRSTPRWSEQFGRVLVEAMATGVPVVASDSGEIPGVVGDAGVLVPEGDTGALADALARLACSGPERSRLARRGRTRVERHFVNERVADETVAFYRALLDGEGS